MKANKVIVGISGSIRHNSSTQKSLKSIENYLPKEVDYIIYDGLQKLPHFNPDFDGEEPPEEVSSFRSLLDEADAVIICTPEYIKGVPGVLKNGLEWLVSSANLYTKPVAVITSSGGGENAHNALVLNLSMLNADVDGARTLLISAADRQVNEEGAFIKTEVIGSLKGLIDNLARQID